MRVGEERADQFTGTDPPRLWWHPKHGYEEVRGEFGFGDEWAPVVALEAPPDDAEYVLMKSAVVQEMRIHAEEPNLYRELPEEWASSLVELNPVGPVPAEIRPGRFYCIDDGPSFYLDRLLPGGRWLIYALEVCDDWYWEPSEVVEPTIQRERDDVHRCGRPVWADDLDDLLATVTKET